MSNTISSWYFLDMFEVIWRIKELLELLMMFFIDTQHHITEIKAVFNVNIKFFYIIMSVEQDATFEEINNKIVLLDGWPSSVFNGAE